MHNRRSTTTCYRLTMVALKLFIPRHRMHKDNSYRLTMVALKLLTTRETMSICICYRLTMVALKLARWNGDGLLLLRLSLNHGRVETGTQRRKEDKNKSYRLTMVALKQVAYRCSCCSVVCYRLTMVALKLQTVIA